LRAAELFAVLEQELDKGPGTRLAGRTLGVAGYV
jgi:hypothetical protein